MSQAWQAKYTFTQYIIEYWLSCYDYLEKKNNIPENNVQLGPILSMVRNFIEPRGLAGEETTVKRFVGKLKEKFEANEPCNYLMEVWHSLDPSGIYEVKIEQGRDYNFNGAVAFGNVNTIPNVQVVHDLDYKVAISEIINATRQLKFLVEEPDVGQFKSVNIAHFVSELLKVKLGYKSGSKDIPAYLLEVPLTQSFCVSNFKEAQVSLELLILIPTDEAKEKTDCPTVLYMPRLSEHYRTWYVTEGLMLNERLLRMEFYRLTNHHLLKYIECYPCRDGDEYEFKKGFALDPFYDDESAEMDGVFIDADIKDSYLEQALCGTEAKPWTGEPLPPLDLGET